MVNYTLWADRGSGANKIYEIGKYLKKCSNGKVKVLGIGPNVGQSYGLRNGKGTVGVFMTNGVGIATPNDFEVGCKPNGYYQYDRVIFVWPQWIHNQWMSNKNIKKHKISKEWDWNRSASSNVSGKTASQWFSSAKYVDLVAGTSPRDIAQRICNQAYVTEEGNPSSPTSSAQSSSESEGSTSSSSGIASSDASSLLQGNMSFEELIGSICNGIDLLFLPKRTVVVVDDFESLYAEAKYLRKYNSKVVEGENIKLWQLEEDSYEMEVNQHGFYNTVYVKYKNGTVRESYDDYVRVFGKIPITYNEPSADKTTAQAKAKAYLAAHVRDFNMSINLSMLTDGDIDIGDIVTVNNPKTYNNDRRIAEGIDPEYLFTYGISTNWDGESPLLTDLELKLAPVSPESSDIPFSGVATGKNRADLSSDYITKTNILFDKCGVSKDKKTICAIGKASAPGESSKYGNGFYRNIFKNKCPFCGKKNLVWDIYWAGNENANFGYCKCKGTSEGGSSEGHIFCKNCDADFSIFGADHTSPPRAYLSKATKGPVKVTKQDAYNLKKGIYQI